MTERAGCALHDARLCNNLATLKQLDKQEAQFTRVIVHELNSDPPPLLPKLAPEEALKLVGQIESMVRTMVDAHRRNWGALVRGKSFRGHADESGPFDIFRREGLIHKSALYLERVVGRQFNALRSYFMVLLGIPLALDGASWRFHGAFGKQWPKLDGIADSVEEPLDLPQLFEFIDEYEEAREDAGQRLTIRELKRVLKSYPAMDAELKSLHEKRLN